MTTFINLKPRIGEEALQELLSYSMFPDPDMIEAAITAYHEDPTWELYGLEQEGTVVAMIGFTEEEGRVLHIRHLVVHPEFRRIGYGRGVILELLEARKPSALRAETDEEAVDFYRGNGFSVVSLGEQYPGVERFVCTYDAELG
ncbi:GNAT family N-acetyltransferase [Paenibacillus mucilaginosus]|uniref:GNAT family acetyltransferase n=2 Tax=Paenibacillus mucilaginosus TaxID=61624 RepID=I0BJ97_9BACL|nr:GNAT family N-acetyltransferase [Paenibacillus mucilaginosus]AEI41661.1 acetyltransferase, GNAT family protein [Paenibacillus mucilaginosus KNP414]AFH62444.1 GNAT family acetyltransferase [Paenibacillus mucilaginosus K02]MCG7214359.1 GNAT family N-acetyltransferase [Paenibacillus mucilaginosus]WDM30646.1 GNAT family N-acetyltransferase [Paenibacillus mucilaginosus]